jgi:hypothetical protein
VWRGKRKDARISNEDWGEFYNQKDSGRLRIKGLQVSHVTVSRRETVLDFDFESVPYFLPTFPTQRKPLIFISSLFSPFQIKVIERRVLSWVCHLVTFPLLEMGKDWLPFIRPHVDMYVCPSYLTCLNTSVYRCVCRLQLYSAKCTVYVFYFIQYLFCFQESIPASFLTKMGEFKQRIFSLSEKCGDVDVTQYSIVPLHDFYSYRRGAWCY